MADDKQVDVVLTTNGVKTQELADLLNEEWTEGALKIWSVSIADRYIDGKVQESIDHSHQSTGRPFMIEYEAYHRLKDEMLRLQQVEKDLRSVENEESS